MIIKCIKIVFRIQRSLLKSFLVFWGPISTKISFWKKNFPKFAQFCPKMTKSRIFQISIVVWGRKMADIRPKNISKVPACPKFLPKFFLSPKLKNWWKIPKQLPPPKKVDFFFGGRGGRIILGTKRQKCLKSQHVVYFFHFPEWSLGNWVGKDSFTFIKTKLQMRRIKVKDHFFINNQHTLRTTFSHFTKFFFFFHFA